MSGNAARVQRKTAVRLTSMTRRHCSTVNSSSGTGSGTGGTFVSRAARLCPVGRGRAVGRHAALARREGGQEPTQGSHAAGADQPPLARSSSPAPTSRGRCWLPATATSSVGSARDVCKDVVGRLPFSPSPWEPRTAQPLYLGRTSLLPVVAAECSGAASQPVTRTARRVGNWHRILARVVGSGSPRDHSTDATSCRTLAGSSQHKEHTVCLVLAQSVEVATVEQGGDGLSALPQAEGEKGEVGQHHQGSGHGCFPVSSGVRRVTNRLSISFPAPDLLTVQPEAEPRPGLLELGRAGSDLYLAPAGAGRRSGSAP
jgi:hypothetical protein